MKKPGEEEAAADQSSGPQSVALSYTPPASTVFQEVTRSADFWALPHTYWIRDYFSKPHTPPGDWLWNMLEV